MAGPRGQISTSSRNGSTSAAGAPTRWTWATWRRSTPTSRASRCPTPVPIGSLLLLGTDLDGPDIARELVVSLNTLRTHTKNVYGKLGVNTRRAAVRRAAELALL